MMGFGPFDHGSFSSPFSPPSSSSTLSPLAPPFTVDHLSPPPIPAAPPHVLEDPYDNWLHLHPPTSNSNAISPPNPEIIPIGSGFGYFGTQPIGFHDTHLPPSSAAAASAPGFTFGQRSEAAATSSLLEAEPYYPQYPPGIRDKNSSISKDFGYGVSNSRAPSSEGSYESGFGENSSGFGLTAKRTGLWMDAGRGALPNYSKPSLFGDPAADGFVMPEEASGVWHGKCMESLAKKAHISSKCTGSEQLDATYTAISQENTSPKMPVSSVPSPSSILQEVSYSRISDPDPSIKSWNPFNLNKTPYDKCFAQLDSCTAGPKSLYPSATMFSFNMSDPSLEKITSKNVMSMDQPAGACSNNDNPVDCISANSNAGGNEGNTDTSGTSNEMDKICNKFLGFPLTKTDLPSNLRPVISLRYPSKEKSKIKGTQLSAPKAFASVPDTAGSGDFMGSSSEMLDQFIPAIDSPCWKGSPCSQHSTFGVVEAPVHLPLVKESEGCSDLNKQNQLLPTNVNDAEAVSSLKRHENYLYFETGCVKKGSSLSFSRKPSSAVTFPCAEQICTNANKSGSDFLKVGKGKGIQSSAAMQESSNESSFELETSSLKPLSHERDISYTTKPTSESRIADPGIYRNEKAQNFSSDFFSHAGEHASNVSSSGAGEIGDMHGVANVSSDPSPPRLDTLMLLKMIHNLSELLLSHHYSDGNALKENDCEVLKHAISNLETCVLNKVGLMRPRLASFPGMGSLFCLRKSTDPREGTIAGGSPRTAKEADDILSDNKEGNIHSWNRKFDKGSEMTQAIKKVMKENIREQGEKDPQTLLYKNLWIEAEAALCSMKYELAHVKFELEKYKQHQATGVATDSHCSSETAMEILSSSNAIGGCDGDDFVAPKLDESSTENVITTLRGDVPESSYRNPQEVNQPTSIFGANDLESSVMARFKILQNRLENLSSTRKVVQTKRSDAIDNGERHGQVPILWCLERHLDVEMDNSPSKVVDQGFAEMRKPWSFITDQLEDESSEERKRLDVERLGVQSTDDIGFLSYASKLHEMSESGAHIADEMVSQLLEPLQLGNSPSLDSNDSPSSDWQHVLKEELSL